MSAKSGIRWRPVPEFPRYEVSEHGVIRTRFARTNSPAGKVIKQRINAFGRPYVVLQEQGRIKTYLTHVVVARAFFGPAPPGREVNHKDGNNANNSVANLQYVTRSQNRIHAVQLGLVPSGERHWQAKLRNKDIPKILQLISAGKSQRQVAIQFKVSRATISNIQHGKTWRLHGAA